MRFRSSSKAVMFTRSCRPWAPSLVRRPQPPTCFVVLPWTSQPSPRGPSPVWGSHVGKAVRKLRFATIIGLFALIRRGE
eukprot:14555734-Alexandrium_andersonii.AAC.1